MSWFGRFRRLRQLLTRTVPVLVTIACYAGCDDSATDTPNAEPEVPAEDESVDPDEADRLACLAAETANTVAKWEAYVEDFPYGMCTKHAEWSILAIPLELEPQAAEVKQPRSRAIWQRCSVGQTFDGTKCEGKPTRLRWKEAKQGCTGMHRLPSVDDFKSLLGGCERYEGTVFCEPCKKSKSCAAVFGRGTHTYWADKQKVAEIYSGEKASLIIPRQDSAGTPRLRCLRMQDDPKLRRTSQCSPQNLKTPGSELFPHCLP